MSKPGPKNRENTPVHETGHLAKPGSDLAALLNGIDGSIAPRPVESWNPPECPPIGLKIRRDGVWLYQESPINRSALVRLFASILRKDSDGKTYLVTPVEKIQVEVEDAPFLAVEMSVSGEGSSQVLKLRTNTDDIVTIDSGHPLRFLRRDSGGGLKPYVTVRGRLEALLTRAVYADLAELAVQHSDSAENTFGVWSSGIWWKIAEHDGGD